MSNLLVKPRWATDPDADVVEPTEGKKDSGWVGGGEKPPFETANWLAEQTHEWIDNLADGAATYPTLQSFIANAEEGDTGMVQTYDGSEDPWVRQVAINLGGGATDVVSVDTDGEVVVTVESDATVRVLDADTLVERGYSPLTLFATPSVLEGVVRAVTNGTFIAVAYTSGTTPSRISRLELFNQATGALIWRASLGSDTSATDCAIDGAYAYWTNDDGSGALTHLNAVLFGAASGGGVAIPDFSVAWGAALHSVWSDGVRLYMAGAAKVGASPPFTAGVHIGVADIALSAGAPAILEWELTVATVLQNQSLACDGLDLYVLDSVPEVRRYAASNGTAIGGAFAAADVSVHLVNERYYFQGDDGGSPALAVHDLPTAGLAASVEQDSFGGDVLSLASDGDAVYVGTTNGAGVNLVRLRRGVNNTRRWRRMAPGDTFMQARALALPMEDSR